MTQLSDFYARVTPALGYLAAFQDDASIRAAQDTFSARIAEADEALTGLKSIEAEMKELARLSREDLQKVGAAKHAVHFGDVAGQHEKSLHQGCDGAGPRKCFTIEGDPAARRTRIDEE